MKVLSPKAPRLIVTLAQKEGRRSGSDQLLPEHVLLALLKSADGLGYILLQALHLNVLTFQLALEQSLTAHAPVAGYSDLPPGRRLHAMLDVAAIESRSLSNEYIGTEHLVLAAIREEQSITERYFEKASITIEDARSAVRDVQLKNISSASERTVPDTTGSVFQSLLGSPGDDSSSQQARNTETDKNTRKNQSHSDSFLAEFSRDLTGLAREGASDPVVGRKKEIRRVIQILSRRTKNNPVLIGEPGVGKTAIVEGLSQYIAAGEVPRNLLKKRILSLDLAAMIAGTKYRGEFEERMKKMMKEVDEDKNIILFIDELHTIIGAGGPEGTMDASNIIKPALSRGELQIIGATTTKEYRKYIEKDSALERRFQIVKVEEPDDAETTAILEGIKSRYEDFHGVIYDDDVIPTIVKFARRYIPERFLPDKAIDILDEAGAAKKIQEELRPAELEELEKSEKELEEEKKALVQSQDFEKAAIVRDKVKTLQSKLEIFRNYWEHTAENVKKRVTAQDISVIISNMTGIPLSQLDENETRRLLDMEKEIHKTVIGQDEAINLIAGAVRRNRAGVSSLSHPVGSFIFLGPTGVGKTQLAKSLAKFLFGTEESLIRIDMSDYMEKHNASRLVGAPPGYVGYEEGGVLTEKVRQHPYSVVLLDEIEKAHPDVFNLLLQLLEEGELSDNLGHTVNFRNTVIIMTSNAGVREITSENRLGFSTETQGVLPYTEIRASAIGELKKLLSPELLNRIDDVVVFRALTEKQVDAILSIQLDELRSRLSEKNFGLTIRPKARTYLVENGYDVSMGARPMRRLIQREIEDPLSKLILENRDYSGNEIIVDTAEGKLSVRFKRQRKLKSAEDKKLIGAPSYREQK
jgi:ATP-dependent Clp protease ATP-binding subunit ClpC